MKEALCKCEKLQNYFKTVFYPGERALNVLLKDVTTSDEAFVLLKRLRRVKLAKTRRELKENPGLAFH